MRSAVVLCATLLAVGVADAATSELLYESPTHEQAPEELMALRGLAPEQEVWRTVVIGLYESTGENGEIVRAYLGESGRELYLMKLRDLLHAAVEASSGKDERSRKAQSRVSNLTALIDAIQPIEARGSKIAQSASSYKGGCQFQWRLQSDFEANTVLVDHPEATATMTYSNEFSPPAPGPLTFYRAVTATVEVSPGSGDWTDFDSANDAYSQIQAYAIGTTFGGSCYLETDHIISGSCNDFRTEYFHALSRKQTCSGVINGDPIQESW